MGVVCYSRAVQEIIKNIRPCLETAKKYGIELVFETSLPPEELKKLVEGVRNIESAFGNPVREIPEIEKEIRKVHRVSIVSKVDIFKGTIITKDMLTIKKPGIGIMPKYMNLVVGRTAKVDIEADRLIKWDYI